MERSRGRTSPSGSSYDQVDYEKQDAGKKACKRYPPRTNERSQWRGFSPAFNPDQREVHDRKNHKCEARRQIGEARERNGQRKQEDRADPDRGRQKRRVRHRV